MESPSIEQIDYRCPSRHVHDHTSWIILASGSNSAPVNFQADKLELSYQWIVVELVEQCCTLSVRADSSKTSHLDAAHVFVRAS